MSEWWYDNDDDDGGDDDNDRGSLLSLAFHFSHLFIHTQRTHLNSSSNQCWSHFQHTTAYVHSTAQTQQMSEGGLSRVRAIYCLHYVFNLSISKAFFIFVLCVQCLQIIFKLSLSVIPFSTSIGKVVTEISIFGALPNAESWWPS